MTWLLSLFTSSVPFGGAIIVALLLAGGGFYAYESVQFHGQINSLTSDNSMLRCKIDGPTGKSCPGDGYVALLGAANARTAQVRANLVACQATVDDNNAKLAALSAQAATKAAANAAALADLAASQSAAKQLVAQIASFKPTANACMDGDDILKMAGR